MARTPSDTVINEYGVVALYIAGSSRGPSEARRVQKPSPGRWIAVFFAVTDGHRSVALAMRGNLGAGIGGIEASIARSEKTACTLADQSRLMLCEILSANGLQNRQAVAPVSRAQPWGSLARRAVRRVAGRNSRRASAPRIRSSIPMA